MVHDLDTLAGAGYLNYQKEEDERKPKVHDMANRIGKAGSKGSKHDRDCWDSKAFCGFDTHTQKAQTDVAQTDME